MRSYEMNNEQYVATRLAKRLEQVAQRLNDLAADALRTAGKVASFEVKSYTEEVSTFQNAVTWGYANLNLGLLTDHATGADMGRVMDAEEADRNSEINANPDPWANLTDAQKDTIRMALAHAGQYAVAGLQVAASRDLFDRVTGEESALASLDADEDELDAQHCSMA